jgi:hypothetical protein
MNYTKLRKEIEQEMYLEEEQESVEQFKDILRKENIDLY